MSRYNQYRKWVESDPFRYAHRTKRSHAKKIDVEYDLDSEYLREIWPEECPVFGTELPLPGQPMAVNRQYGAQLDRIDPTLGYIKGNVAWISGRANRIKYNATIEELEKLVGWMKRVTTSP